MSVSPSPGTAGHVSVVVVTFQSASVIERCLAALARAAPRRGVEAWVVDNASTDDSARLAERAVGPGHVVRLPVNRGYAAGVNAGIARATGAWIAVLNPDTEVPPGALDALVDQLESLPRAGLLAPSICDDEGRVEASAGRFPTLERERAHALALDRALGREGRTRPFPPRTAPVDWASGCAWLLRAEAAHAVGPLDEEYFMYFEDVDYGRRLWDAGWQVLATPDVRLVHLLGRGSASTSAVPADGGAAAARYLRKFLPAPEADAAVGWLRLGWRVRWAWRSLRGALGDRRSSGLARRYRLALEATARQ